MRAAPPTPTNGWTGGQYSLYRVALAAVLIALVWIPMPTTTLSGWLPWSGQLTMSDALRVPLTAIACCIAAGFFDRWFAAVALVAAFCLGRGYAWWLVQPLLLAHALTPPAPFGSIIALQRPDPGGGWRRSRENLAVASLAVYSSLAAVAVSVSTSGSGRGESAAAWALVWGLAACGSLVASRNVVFQRATWFGWVAYCAYAMIASSGPHAWWLALIPVTLATFDPAIVRPRRRGDGQEVVYYDGDCGLCHRTVRFLLAEDAAAHFRFAALQGDHFAQHVSEAERAALGDSVVVRTGDGRLLQRSSAIVHLLLALGGLWRVIGSAAWIFPRPLRDVAYDGVARVRKRLFAAPEGLCPMIPPDLGARFLP